MSLLFFPRIYKNKIVCLIKNISNSRVNIFTTQQRVLQILRANNAIEMEYQKFQIPEDNTPIEMDNPYVKEKKQCFFCKHKIVPDYKNVKLLSQFQSQFSGRIYGRHMTGLCKRQQELLEREILKAQHAGLMGFVTKNPEYFEDPKLFNTNVAFKEKICRH